MKVKLRLPLKRYFFIMMVCVLGANWLGALALFRWLMAHVYHGHYTPENTIHVLIWIALGMVLVMAHLMFIGASHLVRPLETLTDAVAQVQQGNLDVQIERNPTKRGTAEYYNELDQLSEGFNQMVQELNQLTIFHKDFISNVSHQYKTPLANLLAMLELLEETSDEAERAQYISWMQGECKRLALLSEHVLQLAQLEPRVRPLPTTTFRLDEVVRQALIRLQVPLSEHDTQLVLDLAPISIESHQPYWLEICMNLLDNAIKYAPPHRVLSIQVQANHDRVWLSIQDQGKGIAPHQLRAIFEPFYRAASTQEIPGYGIGLALVQQMVDAVGATIECTSVVGEGTTMEVSLPLKEEHN